MFDSFSMAMEGSHIFMFLSQKCEEKILEESRPLVINHIITFYCLGCAETVSPAAGNASGAAGTQSSFHGSLWGHRPIRCLLVLPSFNSHYVTSAC